MNMNDGKNIIICGVGGQGIVLLGKILGEFYLKNRFEIKVSDIVGLGQRGGSVVCHFRYSEKSIFSPLIKIGDADCVISFELTETIRNLHYLKDDGMIFTSTFEISSPTVNVGIEKGIQGDMVQIIKDAGKKTIIFDIENDNGSDVNVSQTANIVMLGIFSSYMGYDDSEIIDIMKNNINSKFIEGNIKAYQLGKEIFEKQRVLLK